MNETVQRGQSFFDKAIDITGNVDNAFAMALANGLSVTDDLPTGTQLKTSGTIVPAIAELFASAAISIATAYVVPAEEAAQTGIGFWKIGTTFIVS